MNYIVKQRLIKISEEAEDLAQDLKKLYLECDEVYPLFRAAKILFMDIVNEGVKRMFNNGILD
jgi:hypothetical protein